MPVRTVLGIGFAVLLSSVPAAAYAQTMHHDGHQHMEMEQGPLPTEPGQAAFAAIAEIVEILKADPDTDWSRVDIDRLRMHLVDMNELTLNAVVEQADDGNSVVFDAMGTGRTLDALHRMVPAHAAQLNATTQWRLTATDMEDGVRLTVTTDDPQQLAIVKGLGFFGVMATGAHHQAHHLAIARGDMEY